MITGGSRGIGLAIAKKCARDNAIVAILAKTTTVQPKLPGTIYTSAEEPNFTVYIIYKKKQLQFKFNISRLTSDNLKTNLKILLKETFKVSLTRT